MQVITDQVTVFSKDNKPCATAKPGEVLLFKTLDCFSNRIPDEQTTMADLDYSYGFANPAAGPVYIEGAEPGDVLVVDIFDVEVADEGTIATDDHCGPLFETTGYRTKKIPIKDGMATFNEVSFPIDPMIGVIGTAPSGPDVIDGFVGSHGGNMDNKKITKGTRLYFPVRVPGALLQMGDVHATMGDAELCGTGIEIPAEITCRVQLVKDFELNWPVLETFGEGGKWYVNSCGEHYEQALMNGSKELQRLLMRVTGWDAVETYMYMSVQSDVEVNQGCEPCEVDVSLRIGTRSCRSSRTDSPAVGFPLPQRTPRKAESAKNLPLTKKWLPFRSNRQPFRYLVNNPLLYRAKVYPIAQSWEASLALRNACFPIEEERTGKWQQKRLRQKLTPGTISSSSDTSRNCDAEWGCGTL